MIYFVFNKPTAVRLGYPEVACMNRIFETGNISSKILYNAATIFEFKDGKVVYHKMRSGKVYTEEDFVFLKLKAVEIKKS